MANNENRDFILSLLRIGARYLLPIAKEAFYEYRDRVLEAHKVSPEERAELLEWIFDEPTNPADPPIDPPIDPVNPPSTDLGKYGTQLTEHPRAVDYPNGGIPYQYGDEPRWTVEQKGVGAGKAKPPWHEVDFA